MSVSRELLFFVSTLGWFNGLFLSIYFLFLVKNRKLSGILFGLVLLALSVRVAKSVLWWFYPNLPVIVVQVGLVACLFIGPLLYYYLKASVNGINKMPLQWKITLAVYATFSLVLLIFLSAKSFFPLWRNYIIPAIYAQWIIYVLVAGFLLKPVFLTIINKEKRLKANDKWLLAVYMGNFMVAASYILAFPGIKLLSYITGAISFSIILYLNTLILFYRKKTSDLFQSEPEKYANKKMDAAQASSLIEQLDLLMKEQRVYANPDLKLNDLAALLRISGHQLSQLLNDNLGKSFNSYINDYRIRQACEIIATDSQLKLEAVGYDVGFNSKSTFFTAFKKYTGTTPKLYKEKLVQREL
jgi:AraC-like DNA-binding protein